MPLRKPTIVLITTHSILAAVYERHLMRFAKVVVFSTCEEFERNALRLHAALLVIDGVEGAMAALNELKKKLTVKRVPVVVLCKHATHRDVDALHGAGAHDILFTIHHTPRAVAERLHKFLLV